MNVPIGLLRGYLYQITIIHYVLWKSSFHIIQCWHQTPALFQSRWVHTNSLSVNTGCQHSRWRWQQSPRTLKKKYRFSPQLEHGRAHGTWLCRNVLFLHHPHMKYSPASLQEARLRDSKKQSSSGINISSHSESPLDCQISRRLNSQDSKLPCCTKTPFPSVHSSLFAEPSHILSPPC